jgi:hypothetical protein
MFRDVARKGWTRTADQEAGLAGAGAERTAPVPDGQWVGALAAQRGGRRIALPQFGQRL